VNTRPIVPDTASRSHLAHFLAVLYGLAIAYASLQPFAPWIAPAPGTPFFVFAPFPPRWTRFDAIANVVAYVPFGFFVALIPRRRSLPRAVFVALVAGGALSLAMETTQMFLPPRDASTIDLLFNAAGATAGGAAAGWIARSERAAAIAHAVRNHWFLPGKVGDLGLALLAIWLVAQLNPGIALFATTFDAEFPFNPAAPSESGPPPTDIVAVLLAAATSAFQLLGVGLFLALLLRQRRYVGGAVLALIGAALLVKGLAAATLLKPAMFGHWLTPGVSTGVAAGALLLLAAIWLPRPVQIALAAIALLSSVLTPLLTPEVLFARAPLWVFNWSYGHLLNFNGLTHTVLLVWPVAASAFLFALAGKPDWGEPE
jgi:VanZ family protein